MSDTQAPGTALSVVERASIALGAAEHERKLIELAKQSTEIVAITNPAAYQQLHAARMVLKKERINIEKLGKDARDDAQKFSKAVIQEEKRLIGLIEPEEVRLQAIQDTHDAEVAAKKAAAERAEAERVERIQAGIRDIKNALIDVAGRGSAAIEDNIRELVGQEISEATCQEFKAEAEAAREATLAKLREMHAAALEQEAEAARLKAEREELTRLRAEQVERERVARERAESELKRIAAEQAHLQKVRDAEEATRRKAIEDEERASRARIEEHERQARGAREQADREAQALRDSEAERLRVEQGRIDNERRALEEKQRQEREAEEAKARVEREAQEAQARQERLAVEQREREERERQEAARLAKEAEEREAQRKANELLDGREMLATFKGRFGHREEFAPVVKAINIYLAPRSKSQAKRVAAQTA